MLWFNAGRGLSSGRRRSQALHVHSQPVLLGLCCCLLYCSLYIRCLHPGCGSQSLKHLSTTNGSWEPGPLDTAWWGQHLLAGHLHGGVDLGGSVSRRQPPKTPGKETKGELYCADVVLQLKAWFCGDLGFVLRQVMLKDRVKGFLSCERIKQFLSGQGWKMWPDVGFLQALISVEPHSEGFEVLLDHHTYAVLVGPCCLTMNRSSWRACEEHSVTMAPAEQPKQEVCDKCRSANGHLKPFTSLGCSLQLQHVCLR